MYSKKLQRRHPLLASLFWHRTVAKMSYFHTFFSALASRPAFYICLRVFLGVSCGMLFSRTIAKMAAKYLPLSNVDAVVVAITAGFLILACAIICCFAINPFSRMCVWMGWGILLAGALQISL